MTLIQSQDRGDTLYVGSRKSDVLGRLYDKGRESREPAYAGCWRWEVQYRRAYALQAARGLLGAANAQETITATVGGWFRARDVGAPFGATNNELGTGKPKQVPDDEAWLTWVRRCVQPRAMELVGRYGWRFVAEALAGPIKSYEDWETLTRGIEYELEDDVIRKRGA